MTLACLLVSTSGLAQSNITIELMAQPDMRPPGSTGTLDIALTNIGSDTASASASVNLSSIETAVGSPVVFTELPVTECAIEVAIGTPRTKRETALSKSLFTYTFDMGDLSPEETQVCQVGFDVDDGLVGMLDLTWSTGSSEASLEFGSPAPVIFVGGFENPVCSAVPYHPLPSYCGGTFNDMRHPILGLRAESVFNARKTDEELFCLSSFESVWGHWAGDAQFADIIIAVDSFLYMPFFAIAEPGTVGEISYRAHPHIGENTTLAITRCPGEFFDHRLPGTCFIQGGKDGDGIRAVIDDGSGADANTCVLQWGQQYYLNVTHSVISNAPEARPRDTCGNPSGCVFSAQAKPVN